MDTKSLVVSGAGFLRINTSKSEWMRDFKKTVKDRFVGLGYFERTQRNPFTTDGFGSIIFIIDIDFNKKLTYKENFRRFMDGKTKEEFNYGRFVHNIASEIPFQIVISFKETRYKGQNGVLLKVISEPAVLFKNRNYGFKLDGLSQEKISRIIYENEKFVDSVIDSFHGEKIEDSSPLVNTSKTSFDDKLKYIGLEMLANILAKVYSYYWSGKYDECLSNLRSFIDSSVKYLAQEYAGESKSKSKLKYNLNVLRDKGYIPEFITIHLVTTLDSHLCHYLSAYSHADKTDSENRLTKNDVYHFIQISENYVDYLIEKVIFNS